MLPLVQIFQTKKPVCGVHIETGGPLEPVGLHSGRKLGKLGISDPPGETDSAVGDATHHHPRDSVVASGARPAHGIHPDVDTGARSRRGERSDSRARTVAMRVGVGVGGGGGGWGGLPASGAVPLDAVPGLSPLGHVRQPQRVARV